MEQNFKTWFKAAMIRAIKTFFQTVAATIGTAAVFSEIEWKIVLSSGALALLLSVFTSLAGLPEVKQN